MQIPRKPEELYSLMQKADENGKGRLLYKASLKLSESLGDEYIFSDMMNVEDFCLIRNNGSGNSLYLFPNRIWTNFTKQSNQFEPNFYEREGSSVILVEGRQTLVSRQNMYKASVEHMVEMSKKQGRWLDGAIACAFIPLMIDITNTEKLGLITAIGIGGAALCMAASLSYRSQVRDATELVTLAKKPLLNIHSICESENKYDPKTLEAFMA